MLPSYPQRRVIHRRADRVFQAGPRSDNHQGMVELPDGLHGAYLRRELGPLIGRNTVAAALKDRRLTSFTRVVVVDAQRATGFLTRAAAALLCAGPDAALTGITALSLHGCTAADQAPVHVLVPYWRRLWKLPGTVIHHGDVQETVVVEIQGLRCVSADFALAAVLCRGAARSALACADQMLALCDDGEREEFRAWVSHQIAARPDPRGRRRGQALLDLATGLAESPPESWTLLALVEAGFPLPVPQFRIVDAAGREIYRLDLAWPNLRICVEYDGYVAHELQAARDARREQDLRRRGWIVIRATAEDLKDFSRVISEVEAAFRARGVAA